MNLKEAEETVKWLSYKSNFDKVRVHDVEPVIRYLIAELKKQKKAEKKEELEA